MWPSVVKIQYTELKLSCGNDPVVKNSIHSNGDLDLWPNDPKIIGLFPFHRGIMWQRLVKIRYTELKLSCGNLCGRPPVARRPSPAIPNHIIRPVSRRTYKNNIGGPMNIPTYQVWFQLARWFQRRRLKWKSLRKSTTDSKKDENATHDRLGKFGSCELQIGDK